MTSGSGPAEQDDATYTYDALDRRDRRTEAGKTFNYNYLGLSEKVSRETSSDGSSRRYEYDSQLQRLGQRTAYADGSRSYRAYATDANGSVEGLEDPDGDIKECTDPADTTCRSDAYSYDPYGQLEGEESKLAPEAKENPFRFEGFYYDANISTYDMQARPYRPDIGRFATADRYESASRDIGLQADPLTNDRYAFAGGNPVNNVEFDGHEPIGSYNPNGEQIIRGSRGRSAAGQRAAKRCGCNSSSQPPSIMPSTSAGYTTKPILRRATIQHPRQVDLTASFRALNAQGLYKPPARQDNNLGDYLLNDLGGDLQGLVGGDLGIGDPNSETYQKGKAFYGSTEAQIASLFVPGLGVTKVGRAASFLGRGASNGGSRRLYRAVEPGEAADVKSAKQFRPSPTGSESKYFYGSRKEAVRFARAMNENGFNYNRITSGRFDSDLLGRMQRPLLTGVERGESFTVPNELLSRIGRPRTLFRRP